MLAVRMAARWQLTAMIQTFDIKAARKIYTPRKQDSYKGDYGHVLMVAGSAGMCGAAILSTRACLHSGAGLATVWSEEICRNPLQTSVPEAMFIAEEPSFARFDVAACGCGLGRSGESLLKVKALLSSGIPLVLDADALNLIAFNNLQGKIPQDSILTPHVGEFERLAGKCQSAAEREAKAACFAHEHKIVLVLKGHRSKIFAPGPVVYENTTGNAGMATAGSGDVLCGIIASLLAQKYTPLQAAAFGVFLHGAAGDFASRELSEEYITAMDIINHLPQAFLTVKNK